MHPPIPIKTLALVLAFAAFPGTAIGQRVGENVVASSDDAFGTSVGVERSGIYNEYDTRGYSPLKAGNARLDGIYFDPVALLSSRMRSSYSIRVGIAADRFAFPAPTGIVDNRLRSAGNSFVASASVMAMQFWGDLEEVDLQVPLVKDHLSLAAGFGRANTLSGDGGGMMTEAMMLKPVIRFDGIEISPFFAPSFVHDDRRRVYFVTSGADVPPLPPSRHYLGQQWARGKATHVNAGFTARIPLAKGLALRGGLFRSSTLRKVNYSEIVKYAGPGSAATHLLAADPEQDAHSWSGEAQLWLRLGQGTKWTHRLIAGFRARDRYTESGGSIYRDYGAIDLFGFDPEPEETFDFSNAMINHGRVRQSAFLLGYQGNISGFGHVNLGLQRARYRATFADATKGVITASRDDPWLYNASLTLDLTDTLEFYAGIQKGLEDSGAAPESAANRNAQLPTTRSKQVETGLRFKSGKNRFVLSFFQIAKPYFSFDQDKTYSMLGNARYRGAEISAAAHFGRLAVLAGAVALKPEVSGAGRDAGLIGSRAAGAPDLSARVDLQYETDLPGKLMPTLAISYEGNRAVGSRPLASLGNGQLMLPPYATVDLGLRSSFSIGKVPASLRVSLQNLFDQGAWRVIASDTLFLEDHRRLSIQLSADF